MKNFSVLTWNIWFADFEKARRLNVIAGEIRRLQPDFLGLQELTLPTFEAITSTEWFRDLYCWSPELPKVVQYYGSGLFSRQLADWDVMPLPSEMDRHLITATVDDLTVGTVHLESMKQEKRRGEQLDLCFKALAKSPRSILMGDMNFDTPETHPIPDGYADVWPTLHPDDPGFTRDTETNRMAGQFRDESKRKRIDRIFLRSEETKPRDIERLGLDPIDGNLNVYGSDHYGLFARFD